MAWTVRRATMEDATAVAAVAGAAWRDTYAGLLRPATIEAFLAGPYSLQDVRNRIDGDDFLVAEGDAGIVAFADTIPGPERVVLVAFYTMPPCRGRGAGTALLAAIVERHPGIPVTADVLLGNRTGERFYERRGFVPVEQFDGDLFGGRVIERRWWLAAGETGLTTHEGTDGT